MTLHEQYTELLRRGMPEHPNLIFDNLGTNGFVPYIGCNLTHDYIARDLITMHALRWWGVADCGCPSDEHGCRIEEGCPHGDPQNQFLVSDHPLGITTLDRDDVAIPGTEYRKDLLDAILAATEHLANP